MNSISRPKPNESTWLWLVKILTGLLVIALLGVHLTVNHFIGERQGLMSWEEVVRYFSNPWIVFMEMAFVAIVVSHSLIGLRSIILDLHPKPGLLRVIDWILILVGVASLVWGFWLALKVASFNV